MPVKGTLFSIVLNLTRYSVLDVIAIINLLIINFAGYCYLVNCAPIQSYIILRCKYDIRITLKYYHLGN